MEGLYRRAHALRREERLLSLIRREEPLEEGEFEISSREGEEILDHLEEVVTRKKININKGIFSFNPKKSGVFFPVLVNIVALAAVITGILLFAYFSKAREESIVSGSGLLLSTEGRLIEKLKQESEEKLLEKDTEIAEARKKLAEINEERNLLQLEMESRIQSREQELRDLLASELEEERQKLRAGGRSEADIETLLSRLENEKTKEYETQLAAFTRTSEAELEQKTTAMLELQKEYEEILQQKQLEQQELRDTLEKESEAALTTISEDLNRLQKQRQDEQLVLDQIRSFYEQVNLDLSNSRYESALARLTALKRYITQDSIASLPLMRKRNSVELFIIDSITRLIETEQSGPETETAQMADTTAQLTLVSSFVEQADTFYQTGDMERAATFYIQALSEIPAVRQSYERLQSINELAVQQDRQNLNTIIVRGDQLFDQRDYRGALEMYEQAIGYLKIDADTLQNLVDRIAESGKPTLEPAVTESEGKKVEELQVFIRAMEADLARARQEIQNYESEKRDLVKAVEAGRLSESRRIALIDQLSSIQRNFIGYIGLPGSEIERSQEELFTLLQTKLLLKQVLNSEAIRTEYPDLYDAVGNYFKKYGEAKRIEGEYTALRDIIAFIDILANPNTDTVLDPEWYDGSSEIKRALYSELLETLKKLLE